MNRNDKDKLIILGFFIGFILVAVGLIVGTKRIPVKFIFVIMLAIQYLIAVPRICKDYYEVKGAHAKWDRFIPFWNEITIFNSKIAILTIISYVLLIIGVVGVFVPTEVINNLFGEAFMYNFGDWVLRYIAVIVIANDIITALGYYKVMRDVNVMHQQLIRRAQTVKLEVLYYFLLFIPMIRLISLCFLMDRLNKLNRLNKFAAANSMKSLEEV